MRRPDDIPQGVRIMAELEVRRWPLDTDCVEEVAHIILTERERAATRASAVLREAVRRGDATINVTRATMEAIHVKASNRGSADAEA